jgi:hypothetical protein
MIAPDWSKKGTIAQMNASDWLSNRARNCNLTQQSTQCHAVAQKKKSQQNSKRLFYLGYVHKFHINIRWAFSIRELPLGLFGGPQ